MNIKICTKCGVEYFATNEFFDKGNGKFNLRSACKECMKKWRKIYRQSGAAKERERLSCKRYKKSEKGKMAIKRYDQSEKGRIQQKKWRESNAGKIANKNYRLSKKGMESHKSLNEKYRTSVKGKISASKSHKKYSKTKNGRAIICKTLRNYYWNNKISNCMSRRIRRSLRHNKCGAHWEYVVGYSLSKLKEHLENLFKPGMSWNNYGKNGWHIDHKIPVSSFNITSTSCEDFRRCWALKNLQPLWAVDNLRKGNKVDYNEE